jgi:hypothetical protein
MRSADTNSHERLGDFARSAYSKSSSRNGSQINTQIQIAVSAIPRAIMATGHRAMIVKMLFLGIIG